MSQRKAQGMDAMGMSERKEMQDLLQHLAERMGELASLIQNHAYLLNELSQRTHRLEVRTQAHRTLLRSLPVSAWPPMMAGEFVALWEGEDG